MLRRDFLRHGSLWIAAGIITPALLDRMDWARHRIFALGSSLNHARVTLFAPNGEVLHRLALPITYEKPILGGRVGNIKNAAFTFDRHVTIAEAKIEIPVPFGPDHMIVNRILSQYNVSGGDTLTVQFASPAITLVD